MPPSALRTAEFLVRGRSGPESPAVVHDTEGLGGEAPIGGREPILGKLSVTYSPGWVVSRTNLVIGRRIPSARMNSLRMYGRGLGNEPP